MGCDGSPAAARTGWRLNNFHAIADRHRRRVTFTMNSAQEALYRDTHRQNVILKARQRGFTTFIQLLMLDACLFNDDVRAGTPGIVRPIKCSVTVIRA